jgi:tRNA (cytidine/uridine-2'-O-)-methyltransferase
LRVALFEPDIPQNTGTILRLAACLGVEAHIIEPAGFPPPTAPFGEPVWTISIRWPSCVIRAGRHSRSGAAGACARLILFTTRARMSYLDQVFRRGDVLLFGRESSGAADKVHKAPTRGWSFRCGRNALAQCSDGRGHGRRRGNTPDHVSACEEVDAR